MKMNEIKSASILGATGSVGLQAIDVIIKTDIKIKLLTAFNNLDKLLELIELCKPEAVAILKFEDAIIIQNKYSNIKVYYGQNAVCDAINEIDSDLIVHAISGMAGILPAIESAKKGCRIAMANKEAIISCGHLIYDELSKSNGELIPVDSEHSAIFQCLRVQGLSSSRSSANSDCLKRILLTASGGPFHGKCREELNFVSPEMALSHPTWKMGAKITIDSATLMNKGFELIEACRLFNVTPDQVQIVVHKQSIIHSMVEYSDGSVIAEMSYPDMRDCVRYAIYYPDRAKEGSKSLDLFSISNLTFEEPNYDTFPLLNASKTAYYMGGTAPASLIASDEVAVNSFLNKKITFNQISDIVIETLNRITVYKADSIDNIFLADKEARLITNDIISKFSIGE